MSDQIRISAKNLGKLAMPEFCPRCLWLQLRLGHKLPYQIFPGIFSSIDAYTKRMVHGWFDEHGSAPKWLSGLGELVGYRDPPHFSSFQVVNEQFNVLLTGTPDAIFVRPDNSYIIADYKTARFTGNQDKLFPMYETQLNVYGIIAEACGFSPVTGLSLLYFEPPVSGGPAEQQDYRETGFAMDFSCHTLAIDIDHSRIEVLLVELRRLYEQSTAPGAREGCKDCGLVERVIEAVQPDVF